MFKFFKSSNPVSPLATAEDIAAMPIFSEDEERGVDISIRFPSPEDKNGVFKRYVGDGPVVVLAPTRSGKGISVFTPIALTWKGPMISSTMKGELIDTTAGWRAKNGPVYSVWDHEKREIAARFNPFDTIRWGTEYESGDIILLSTSLTRKRDHGIIDQMAAMLIESATRRLHEDERKITGAAVGLELWCSMGENENRFSGRIIDKIGGDLPWWREDLIDKAKHQAFQSLSVFQDREVARMTEATDFDIDQWQDQNATLFFPILPVFMHKYDALVRAAFDTLTRRTSETKKKTMVLLPETLSLGMVQVEDDLQSFMKSGKILVTSHQDISRMHEVYTKKSGFQDACDLFIVLRTNDMKTSDWISKMIGKVSIKMKSTNEKTRWIERPFIAPNEVPRMIGERDALIIPKFRKPFFAEKIPYFKRTSLLSRTK